MMIRTGGEEFGHATLLALKKERGLQAKECRQLLEVEKERKWVLF